MRTTAIFVIMGLIGGAAYAASQYFEAGEQNTARPVVLELYTSEGCSSCPPADRFLGELTERKDILPLSFHVDYWDYIGWKDPFGLPENTERQQAYAQKFGLNGVYTPQMVIDGVYQAVGSSTWQVNRHINRAIETMQAVPVTIASAGDTVKITLDEGNEGGKEKYYKLWLVAYDFKHESTVKRGENRGRRLIHYNVVKMTYLLDEWNGDRKTLDVDPEKLVPSDAIAVLIQEEGLGRIVGAAHFSRIPQNMAKIP